MGVIRNDLHNTPLQEVANRSKAGILEGKIGYSFFSDQYKTPGHTHSESIIFQEALK